ncbi:MAG: TetR/AcrR family transcriptional regulator [Acidimicrobiales bacterium]
MTVQTAEPTRAEIRRQQRQALIVAAAEAQLGEAGLAGMTLERVGNRVGLSKTALYYYVDSRDGLLALILADVLAGVQTDADARVGAGARPVERLTAFARAHVHAAVERPAGQLILANVELVASHAPSSVLLAGHEQAGRRLIEAAMAAGQLRPLRAGLATSVMFGALNTLCRAYKPDGPLGLDEAIDATLDLLLHGWLDPADDAAAATTTRRSPAGNGNGTTSNTSNEQGKRR